MPGLKLCFIISSLDELCFTISPLGELYRCKKNNYSGGICWNTIYSPAAIMVWETIIGIRI
jgi:hypothetical protein